MSRLGSSPVPQPDARDHIRGALDAAVVIEYADFECPFCAQLSAGLSRRRIREVFRHFPIRSSHPRAWAAACAAEAAAQQDRFWEMHDLLFTDQSRLEDPHLWARARALELDLERFDSDRRGEAVSARVRRDFESGVRAGVMTTPTVFGRELAFAGRIDESALARLSDG